MQEEDSSAGPLHELEIIIGHLDGADGRTFEQLRERIDRGDFRGKHIVLLNSFAALQALGGSAESVTIPRGESEWLIPLLVKAHLEASPPPAPARTPVEALTEATRDVRERLQHCSNAADVQKALREEFGGNSSNLVQLFEAQGGFTIERLQQLISALKGIEGAYIQLV